MIDVREKQIMNAKQRKSYSIFTWFTNLATFTGKRENILLCEENQITERIRLNSSSEQLGKITYLYFAAKNASTAKIGHPPYRVG